MVGINIKVIFWVFHPITQQDDHRFEPFRHGYCQNFNGEGVILVLPRVHLDIHSPYKIPRFFVDVLNNFFERSLLVASTMSVVTTAENKPDLRIK